jgi:hypothetical protein
MIAVIFEVWPAEGRREAYLNYAARLKPELEKMDGFITVERFQSITDPTRCCRCRSGATKRPSGTGATTLDTAVCRRPAATACSATTACALPR